MTPADVVAPETFLQRMLRLKAEKQALDRPPVGVTVEPAPEDPIWAGKAARYCDAALRNTAERMAGRPEGDRNQYLNDNALMLYRWALAGHLDVEGISQEMSNAAYTAGLTTHEINATLRSAWQGAQRYGPDQPRLAEPFPEAPTGVFDTTTGEISGSSVRDGDHVGGAPADDETGGGRSPVTDTEGQAQALHVDGGLRVDRGASALTDTGEARGVAPTPEQLAQASHDRAVRIELAQLRAREEAKRTLAVEQAEREFRVPPSRFTLREELAIPDEPVTYTVAELLPAGANATLTAGFKVGKSSLIDELARSWADGVPFLGRYVISPAPGRVAIFNYELSEGQYRRWLREVGIVNVDAVSVLHLRGYRLPLTVPKARDWVTSWLRDHDVRLWVPDPFARAASGTDENSNSEVGAWLEELDAIKEQAGVAECVLPVHTGRAVHEQGAERARGATRLDDWADVRWLLTKDEQGTRYFRATGRDVEVEEEALHYEPETRRLTLSGGDRAWNARRNVEASVAAYVAANPGCSGDDIENCGGKKDSNRNAMKVLLLSHHIRVETGGPHNRKSYFRTSKDIGFFGQFPPGPPVVPP